MVAKTFLGLDVVVEPNLEGAKYAVKVGTRIMVSPAVYRLMQGATQAELKALILSLEIRQTKTLEELASVPRIVTGA